MAVGRGLARLLLAESKRSAFKGDILQLGRQAVHFTRWDMERWAQKDSTPICSESFWYSDSEFMTDSAFFSALGFDRVHSVDLSPHNAPTYIHDLNQPIPEHLEHCYDVVFDGGTMEHVFDPAAVLRNIHRLLKVGGRAIHVSPSNNHRIDEGYYLFSPSLFYDFYSTNPYQVETVYLIEHEHASPMGSWNVYPYKGSGSWKRVAIRSLKGCLSTFFVARKLSEAKEVKIPGRPKGGFDYHLKDVNLGSAAKSLKKISKGRKRPLGGNNLLRRWFISLSERVAGITHGKNFDKAKRFTAKPPPLFKL